MLRSSARYAGAGVQRIMDNPRTGEKLVILRSGDETDGQLLIFDAYLQPGAHVPASHAHPHQEERFTVLAGRVRFRVGGSTLSLGVGQAVIVPRGTSHWFGNTGDVLAQVRVEVRPAMRMQELLESSSTRAGLVSWALIALDFKRELAIPHIPGWLVTACLTPLAWLRAQA